MGNNELLVGITDMASAVSMTYEEHKANQMPCTATKLTQKQHFFFQGSVVSKEGISMYSDYKGVES